MLVRGGRSRLSERSVGRTTIMLRCKLFSAAILLLAACGRDLRFAPPIDVPGVLRNASADPAVEHFDLPLHTDFEWESLVILGPYTDQKRAEVDSSSRFHSWSENRSCVRSPPLFARFHARRPREENSSSGYKAQHRPEDRMSNVQANGRLTFRCSRRAVVRWPGAEAPRAL